MKKDTSVKEKEFLESQRRKLEQKSEERIKRAKLDNAHMAFILKKFPYAIHEVVKFENSEKELQKAKEILGSDIGIFRESDRGLIIKAFACLIRSIEKRKDLLVSYNADTFKSDGKLWRLYNTMIPEFNKVLKGFSYNSKEEVEDCAGAFYIEEVTFKGEKKNQSIKLTGPILSLLESMFQAFYEASIQHDVYRLKQYSEKLYEAYELYKRQSGLLSENNKGLGNVFNRKLESIKVKSEENNYRYEIAFNVHLTLNYLMEKKSKVKYPSTHKRIIGRLLKKVGMMEYDEVISDSMIALFIRRGADNSMEAN